MTDANDLYYMRARFYSPELRRFINQDILLGNITDGQSLNRYAYVTGNPVSFIDPFGLSEMLGGEYGQDFDDGRIKFDGSGDTSVCQYYDEAMKKNSDCSYYKSASQICRGPSDFREDYKLLEILRAWVVDIAVTTGFGLSHSIAIGDGYSLNAGVHLSEALSQIRQGLVEHDVAYRQEGLLDTNGCVCGDYIDEYHNVVFEASGVRAIFYGGNLWWRIYPNPVPDEECQQCGK